MVLVYRYIVNREIATLFILYAPTFINKQDACFIVNCP